MTGYSGRVTASPTLELTRSTARLARRTNRVTLRFYRRICYDGIVIRLRVPGALKYRDLAVRAVAAACKLVGAENGQVRGREFDDQVVSAFGEAFNNAALHSYKGRAPGDVEIEMDVGPDTITIHIVD